MKMQFDYYTQTEGFPDVKIDIMRAIHIVRRFYDMKPGTIKKTLQDGETILCGDAVKVWAEEAMNYRR